MENHPIPQDVTGFKFKLIGSVTIKQFLYLLACGIFATIFFLLPINFFLRLPFMLIFGGIGLALAFIPVEGRPMDTMIINFAKAVPSENQYIYKKRGANLLAYNFLKPPTRTTSATTQQKTEQPKNENDTRRNILLSQLRNHYGKPDEAETKFLKNIKGFFDESATTISTKVVEVKEPPLPEINVTEQSQIQQAPMAQDEIQEASSEADKKNQVTKEVMLLQKQLEDAQKEKEKGTMNSGELTTRITGLQEQLANLLKERDSLQAQVINYEVEKTQNDEKVFKPSIPEEKIETKNVHVLTPQTQLKGGFPTLPDAPNVILGIVKDPRGKVLPNILVEVVDSNNIPVRAFKTNMLGQFASATPLSNGTYKIFFEDAQKRNEFDAVEITLNGEVFYPIEVASVDQREKLRRELFEPSGAQISAAA